MAAHRIHGLSVDAQQLLATAFTEASTNLRRGGGARHVPMGSENGENGDLMVIYQQENGENGDLW